MDYGFVVQFYFQFSYIYFGFFVQIKHFPGENLKIGLSLKLLLVRWFCIVLMFYFDIKNRRRR